ncbi:senescence-associated protein [Senna tora]|uniref:Senescence-associated protein n=1 Tax=Senna tora TaxID=362788 RepID=A0A834SEL0_9FABA|nr:senescence-associated protein [Senna tora]
MSDCLETSCEASFYHRLHFDPTYAREILSRKKVYPCVIDFCTAPTAGDARRRPSRVWPRPCQIALKLLVRLPFVIGFILTQHICTLHFDPAYARHMHVICTCGALPAAGPYLWLSRFQGGQICTDGRSTRARAPGFAATAAPFYSSGPGTCPDGRVSAQFDTVTRLPFHPASPVLLTKNGPLGALDSVVRLNRAAVPSYLFKVCSDSNPSQKIKVGRRCSPLRDPANQCPCALRVYSPVDSHTCQTPWSVFQDGPNGEPAGRRQTARAAIHNRDDDVSTGISTA